jgi:hypothetical protein
VSRQLFATAVLFAVATLCGGCYSIDPTAQSFAVTFRNDTGRDVHLKLCSNDSCTSSYYSDGWKQGQTAQENISDRDALTRWLVVDDATQTTLGCLPLRFKQKYASVVVRISQAIKCPGDTPLKVTLGKPLGVHGDTFP